DLDVEQVNVDMTVAVGWFVVNPEFVAPLRRRSIKRLFLSWRGLNGRVVSWLIGDAVIPPVWIAIV
ncbi:hypothetical protein N7472_005257, partial [Penicillium cf. griseofulvum]